MGYEVRLHVVRVGISFDYYVREDCPNGCDDGWVFAKDGYGDFIKSGLTEFFCHPIAMIELYNPGYSTELYLNYADKKLNPNKDLKWSLNGSHYDAYEQDYYPIPIEDVLLHLEKDIASEPEHIYFKIAHQLLSSFKEHGDDFVVLWEGH